LTKLFFKIISTACLFLAGKVEETPKALRDIIKTALFVKYQNDQKRYNKLINDRVLVWCSEFFSINSSCRVFWNNKEIWFFAQSDYCYTLLDSISMRSTHTSICCVLWSKWVRKMLFQKKMLEILPRSPGILQMTGVYFIIFFQFRAE